MPGINSKLNELAKLLLLLVLGFRSLRILGTQAKYKQ